MIGVNQFTVKTVNIHQSKIIVVMFDDTNNRKGKRDIGKSRVIVKIWRKICVLTIKK